MGAPILREQTIETLRECVLIAEDLHLFGLRQALETNGLAKDIRDPQKARLVFDSLLRAVDWTNRDAIRPLLHIFEDAYAESPIAGHSIHTKVDKELARDGLRIVDGQFVDLGEGSNL